MAEPWVRFEDEHLLVVRKPAGVNTHRADVHAQDGMHEWVQRQRPDVTLSILHRLDKGTSGLLVFGKTPEANRSLTAQFGDRSVGKDYELLSRAGAALAAPARRDEPVGGELASSTFEPLGFAHGIAHLAAHPRTGRTHQVRVHAAALGFPVLGDDEHGGAPAARLFLHAAALAFVPPGAASTGDAGGRDRVRDRVQLTEPAPPSFDRVLAGDDPAGPLVAATAALDARAVLFDRDTTDAFLWIDRHHDGFPGVRVERLGAVTLAHHEGDEPLPDAWLDAWVEVAQPAAVFVQSHARRPAEGEPARLVRGAHAPRFEVRELGSRFLIDLDASATSTGLFLDQRETRRRLRTADLAGASVLNAFGHTGSLSVAAAQAGAETLTLDLSERYLGWARDNLRANDLDPADHDFVYGDALDWLGRFARKGRTFDLVVVDPPSSSTGRTRGKSKRWAVERDLHELVARAVSVCAAGGTVYVSTNLRRMTWPRFLRHLDDGLAAVARTGAIETQTVPLDHRSGTGDPAYLKAAWISLDV